MASDSYDVLILGCGNAGFGVTVPTRNAGMRVALAEDRHLGGTCPIAAARRKKSWSRPATLLHEIEQAHVHHISVSRPKLDWAALIDREKEMIGEIPDLLAETLQERWRFISFASAPVRGGMQSRLATGRSRRAHRHRHRLKLEATSNPWRRFDDHLG